MPLVHAIILGIVQGLSEFLPISSSGHLTALPELLSWEDLDDDLKRTFDVALHVGTFLGAFAYFRSDILRLAAAAIGSIRHRAVRTPDERLAWLLVLASLPAATVGLVLDQVLDGGSESLVVIGLMLIGFGLVLQVVDRLPGRLEVGAFRPAHALLVGMAQALALQPGVSRSGATISMARWLGYDRDAAVRISFLMSLPIIAGAGLYKGIDVVLEGGVPSGTVGAFAWGMVAAAVTGWLAVWGTLRFVRNHSFTPFVAYRVVVGLVVLAVGLAR